MACRTRCSSHAPWPLASQSKVNWRSVAMAFSSVLSGVENKLPRHFEWVAGHAIVATVIWLYVEILILLYKLFARRD